VGAQGYLANLRAGAARLDLAGEPAGTVSAGAAACAAEQLANKMLKADARRKARLAEERPAVKPEPVIEEKPRRLTLSDLKYHALARRQ
jgi:sRNA-binding protein